MARRPQHPPQRLPNTHDATTRSADHVATPGTIWIWADVPLITVTARLRGPATSPSPRPQIRVTDRRGQVSLTEYAGREPYEVILPIQFDEFRSQRSVEPWIAQLERLAVAEGDARTSPIVRVEGPIPPRCKNVTWFVDDLIEIPERTEHNTTGDRVRYAVDVHLIERTWDDLLVSAQQIPTSEQTGLLTRTTTVKKGEDIYDVARRAYGDPGRAVEIARANTIPLTSKLKVGQRLRLPPV